MKTDCAECCVLCVANRAASRVAINIQELKMLGLFSHVLILFSLNYNKNN